MFAGSLRSSARMSEKVLLLSEGHTLPSLPYEYDALEPFIDAETMRIHHGKHHKGYVDKLNQALKENKSEGLTLEEIFAQINKFPSAIRNNAGGHYNHTLFWESMQGVPKPDPRMPVSRNVPDGEIAKEIEKRFGSYNSFEEEFGSAAKGVFGSGWCWLILDGENKLEIVTTPNQDNPLMSDFKFPGKPLLGLDVWEHAYYLKYQNKRTDYIQGWFSLINWKKVNSRLKKFRK